MKWHEEVVTAETIAAAQRIAQACGKEFYLAGGTALALQKGHRISIDLDCFSQSNKLSSTDRVAIIENLKATGPLDIRTSEDRTCHLIVGTTFVSLFHYPYRTISFLNRRWQGLLIASTDDICAMKLSAVLGRGSKKDFIDLYLISKRMGLGKVFEISESKFPDHGNFLVQAARSLVYFDDADTEPMPRMLMDIEWEEVKKYFTRQVPKYLKSHLHGPNKM